MGKYKTPKDLADAGATLVDEKSGPCWSVPGKWNTWVYEMPDGTFWRVHQEADYRDVYDFSEVRKVVTEVVTYEEIEKP